MAKTISILGSTGSIGTSTLDIISKNQAAFELAAITANKNISLLIEQCLEFRPKLAVIGDETLYLELKSALSGTDIEVAAGEAALIDAGAYPSDFLMAGIVGAAGLKPTMAAVRRGVSVGLANKECLVCAGAIFMSEVAKANATLLPVDSEHNAIYQVFDFDGADNVERIILTASGGPFRGMNKADMVSITPEQAIKHPNWDMGAKISVDSATMMNKGLELIEAYHLFPVEINQIDVLVHPQSVVHSMVEYKDGSVLSQMGPPDMRTPIAYALSWPKRMAAPVTRLDFNEINNLTFEPLNDQDFPAVKMCRNALEEGGAAPIVLNAANEIGVESFLNKKIGFLDIISLVAETLEKNSFSAPQTIDDVAMIDKSARSLALEILNER
jgi:1-deoxy-D-xylulose-5-phosphate reductoisomerase